LLAAVLAMVSLVGNTADNDKQRRYNELQNLSSQQLIDMGNDCYFRRSMDTAVACYTIVTDRQQTKTPADQLRLARAYNNLGCVALAFMDDEQAYSYFTKTIELCEQYDINELKLYAKLNLANLFNYNGNQFSIKPFSREAMARYEEIMLEAEQQKDWTMYLSCFVDMVEQNPDINIKKYSKILMLKANDSIKILEPTRILYHAIENEQQGNYTQARQWLQQLLKQYDNSTFFNERYTMIAHIATARTYEREQNYPMAIAELANPETMRVAKTLLEYEMSIYQKLSDYYNKMGDREQSRLYRISYLDKMDSMNQTNGIILSLSNDLHQKEQDNRLLAEQQRRQRNLITGGAIILTLLLALALVLLWANRMVNARNRSLYEKNQAVMRAEAEERQLRKQYEQMLNQREEADRQAEQEAPAKYRKSNLNDEDRQRLISKIQDLFDDTEVICQPDFTVAKLSKLVESNTTYVSQVVNETYGMTFSNLLGRYRSREACRRMDDVEHYGNMTVEAISESVGFRSRAAFLNAFKREIGLAPSEYFRMAKSK